MKLLFFSDIHGNQYALDEFLKNDQVKNADELIFCGDVFGYYYYQNEILDKFRNMQGLKAVLGNHDKMFLDVIDGKLDVDILVTRYGNTYKHNIEKISKKNIEFLRSLPHKLELNIDGCKIGVFHGSPSDPLNGRIYPDTDIIDIKNYLKYDFVILGHTHHRMVKKVMSTLVINPGSLGQQRDGKGCSALLLDLGNEKYDFITIQYNVNKLIRDVDLFDAGNLKLKEVLLRKEKN